MENAKRTEYETTSTTETKIVFFLVKKVNKKQK